MLTGDDIAGAIVHYAEALSQRDTSAVIDVPVLDGHGDVVTANMLIGPASQLVVMPEESAHEELLAPEIVASFRDAMRKLGSPTPSLGADREAFDAEALQLLDDLEFPESMRE